MGRRGNYVDGRRLADRDKEKRSVLEQYSKAGGGAFPTGEFSGFVDRLSYNKVLIKRLSVKFKDANGKEVTGQEDHVWFDESQPFQSAGVKEGDFIRFNAYAKRYMRSDGLNNYGLCRPSHIQIVR